MTDFIITNDPSVIGGTKDETAGRFDATYSKHGTAYPIRYSFTHPLPPGEDDLWLQFGHWRQIDTHYYHDTTAHIIPFADGNPWVRWQAVDGIMAVEVYDGSGGAMTSYTVPNNDETFETWDWHIVRNDGSNNATFAFYINGVQQMTHTGPIGSDVIADRFTLGATGDLFGEADVMVFSNMRLSNVSTLDTRFCSLLVSTVGTYDEFGGGGFAALMDYDAATVATSDAAGQRVSGTINFADVPTGTIASVSVASRSRAEGPSVNPNTLAHFIRDNATNYDQAPVTPGAGYAAIVTEMAINPDTGVAWLPGDLDGMEFGLLSSQV